MNKLSENELKQKHYYNRISTEYDRHYGSANAIDYRKALYERALKNVRLEGVQVLDAMCGGGQNTAALVDQGCQFVGVDLSEGQVSNYQKRFPGTQVRCASILDSGLPSASFDVVICDSLHHLHPHVNQGILEMLRVLKPGGHLLIWEPSAGSLFDRARQFWYRMDRKYFEENEAAIDFQRIIRTHSQTMTPQSCRYGGNLAYLLVFASMAFRIPARWVPFYAPALMVVERFINLFQTRLTSLWVLALFKKN